MAGDILLRGKRIILLPLLRNKLVCLQEETPHPSGKPDTFPSRGGHKLCCREISSTALLHRRLSYMFFHGHAPGKNTLTREHFRRNAAKPP